MKTIQINSPKYGIFQTIVDDDVYEWIKNLKIGIAKRGKQFYATTNIDSKLCYLHHLIAGQSIKRGTIILDHKNHNSLDNQRENLRFTTKAVNYLNREFDTDTKSGYTGITKDYSNYWKNKGILKSYGYLVRIQANGKTIRKFVKTLEEAIKIRKDLLTLYYPEIS